MTRLPRDGTRRAGTRVIDERQEGASVERRALRSPALERPGEGTFVAAQSEPARRALRERRGLGFCTVRQGTGAARLEPARRRFLPTRDSSSRSHPGNSPDCRRPRRAPGAARTTRKGVCGPTCGALGARMNLIMVLSITYGRTPARVRRRGAARSVRPCPHEAHLPQRGARWIREPGRRPSRSSSPPRPSGSARRARRARMRCSGR